MDELEERLINITNDNLEIPEDVNLTLDSSFENLGFNSLEKFELFYAIGDEFSHFRVHELGDGKNVNSLRDVYNIITIKRNPYSFNKK